MMALRSLDSGRWCGTIEGHDTFKSYFLVNNDLMMSSLTQDSEREQKVFEHLGPDFGTFGLRPGLDGLQVALVHPYLNLFRHTVGTGGEKRGER